VLSTADLLELPDAVGEKAEELQAEAASMASPTASEPIGVVAEGSTENKPSEAHPE
jgi:hypothetical protein